MAIYHLAVQTISRGAGRSAVAAAAYRASQRLYDERTGITADYRARSGVVAAGLVGWRGDRAGLWNTAEAAERHPRAQVAREIVLALPHELTADDRRHLIEGFAEWLAERHGIAVDWSIHGPGRGDDRNDHAHLLTTTRRIEGGRRLGAKVRELDVKPTSGEHLRAWRAAWAEHANGALERAGVRTRIDERSHRERSADREPLEHLGPAAAAMERAGKRTRAGDRNRRRRTRNTARAASRPAPIDATNEPVHQATTCDQTAPEGLAAVLRPAPIDATNEPVHQATTCDQTAPEGLAAVLRALAEMETSANQADVDAAVATMLHAAQPWGRQAAGILGCLIRRSERRLAHQVRTACRRITGSAAGPAGALIDELTAPPEQRQRIR